ncbi:pentatricopeptide repeat-containing protein At5g66520-like [Papaver somniferum]|uniref:pentatricopeptide repeat-containing protein At5g66520-like n=1 Tax=Papaver somniferum TaxID=3469 RepID=UPI000E70216B|nr:pentatricopeptide repeat-containing protein At5g66520-like [Papaver somniferum]XP_026453998.1 pentatricopeptide repeat-containing protein At5g66520-like [Papaver somniferum]
MTTITTSVPIQFSSTTTSTLSLLEKCKSMPVLHQIHASVIKTGLTSHTFLMSKLISICTNSRSPSDMNYALSIFNSIEEPNFFIFFTLIRAFADTPNSLQSILLYSKMLTTLEEFHGLEFSIPSVLKACGRSCAFEEGRQVHGQIMKTEFQYDPFVSNSMLRMYFDLKDIRSARRLFDTMPHRDVYSWNSMVAGYLKAGEIGLASEIFREMPERDLVSWNSMIDGLVKHGKCELAREIFEMMKHKNVVSWTCMISGYMLNHRPKEALDLFRKMLSSGIEPDPAAIVSVLSAIADLGFVEEGKWIHSFVCRSKFLSIESGVIGSALIDMYSKCGYIDNARDIFKSISHRRNIGDWNSMLSGLAIHGLGKEALEILHDMERMEIEPDDITFLAVLRASSHGGLVQEGQMCFKTMCEKYKAVPKIQHYGCMIDLYGRAGHLEDALKILQEMPFEPDVLAWKAILSSCLKHGKIEQGRFAALRAIELAPKDSSSYILLSNIYAKTGRWEDVAKIRSLMKERGVKKVPGCSSILIKGEIHEFLVGEEIDSDVVKKLEEMVFRLNSEGYRPDLNQVLVDEEKDKESLLSFHSEKMALAFGLINVSKGAPVHIVKNLRVCSDCHSFFKLVSKVYNRQIILRDQNRFHHFNDGSCSCNDYW